MVLSSVQPSPHSPLLKRGGSTSAVAAEAGFSPISMLVDAGKSSPGGAGAGAAEEAAAARFRRQRSVTFVSTWLAYALLYNGRSCMNVVKSALADEFRLSSVALGTVDSVYLTTYAAGLFYWGSVGDKLGAKPLVVLALAGSAACCALVPAAAAGGVPLVAAVWAANALAQSAAWPGCAKMLAQWFSAAERGKTMGLFCTSYQAGPLAAAYLATALLVRSGWRASFFGAAAAMSLAAALYPLVQGGPPPPVLGLQDADKAREVSAAEREAKQGQTQKRAAPRRPGDPALAIQFLCLTYAVVKFIRYVMVLWLPFYMVHELGYSPVRAGLVAPLFDMSGFFGSMAAGYVSDKYYPSSGNRLVSRLLQALAAVTVVYALGSGASWLINVAGIAALGALVYACDILVCGVVALQLASPEAAASISGTVNGSGAVGSILSGLLVGYASAVVGWSAVFLSFAPVALAGVPMMLHPVWTRLSTDAEAED